jgi:2-oxoglutarate dehydrogenase E2 component (dihydrolipoamide succinyltransferase)
MSIVNIQLPKMGESIIEATVLKWHKKVGDRVSVDDTLLDIATDKVDSEVTSTADGILEEILYKENDVVAIGSVIARIKTSQDHIGSVTSSSSSSSPSSATTFEYKEQNKQENGTETAVPYVPAENNLKTKNVGLKFYSPLVMNIASREGIEMAELENIAGTGTDGRVSKKDILNYIAEKDKNKGKNIQYPNPATENTNSGNTYTAPQSFSGSVEIVEMDRMRKLIATHMRKSLDTSAHVTSFAEADVTNLVSWRDKIKKDFEKREGEKFTITPIFIEAISKCIRKYPMLNASVEGDKILIKKDVNIGMATALPNGNLIVPVIHNVDQLSIIGIAKQVNRLANQARNNQLQPTAIQDGTFTFTNVGTFGSLMGTPIINQPQVAILATGAIKKKPVVIETEKGDSIAIRYMMFVSISYDHRIIDGGLGSLFLSAFVSELESFDINRSL